MSPIRTLSVLLPLAAGLALLGACSSSPPSPAASVPSPSELASRTVEVDSGLWVEEEPSELAAAEVVEEPDPVEPSPEPQLSTSWTVRRGESIAHFARWAELPVETIAEASDRSLGQPLQVGDTLVVPGDGETRAKVEQARQRHHQIRAEAYLATRGGSVGTAFHTVTTGETGWSVATRELGLPVWLVEAYNPAMDLEHLRPGEQLLYPVVADTVASLDEPAEATPASNEVP